MSTPGSVRNAEAARYTPSHDAPPGRGGRRGARIFRWQGIVPIVLLVALLGVGWVLFGERTVRVTLEEAGTKALGTQLDIAGLDIQPASSAIELRGVAIADPFDRTRNLLEIAALRVEVEPTPLLEKKLLVRRLSIADVRTGTRRASPAAAVTGPGFAPRALAEVRRFAQQFNVPLLSLTPIDTLKAIVLDPTQLQAVQASLAAMHAADSVRQALAAEYAALDLQPAIDSSAALVSRLQTTNVRTLGIDGARRAVADVRAATARIDAAKARVEGLVANARRGADSLQASLRAIDTARRADYAFARSLLKLPSFEGPDIGSALFGKVTIDRFQQAVYWSTLARQYAPPGLLPRESPGPRRLRRAGTTVHFASITEYPRFLLRRADAQVTVSSGTGKGTYAFAASDVTSDPAIVGQPALFALRRVARGSDVDSLRVMGSFDHTTPRLREVVSARAAGVALPAFAVPGLPFTMDPGRGTSELRLQLDGEQIAGRWTLRSSDLAWRPDSATSRKLNTLESLVARVLTGIHQLDLTADVSGTLQAPRLAVRSNLDRQVADRLRAVAGEEITAAQARVRAQVDRLVEEKAAPVRARVAEVRAEADRRIAEARTRLDEEKRKLDERLKALTGGLVGLPGLPGG